MNQQRIEAFRAWSGGELSVTSRAPGRVNLIGEHTDYNEGYVLPVAIDREVSVLSRPVEGRRVRMRSDQAGEEASFWLGDLHPSAEHPWLNYAIGIVAGVQARGHELPGMDLMVWSSVPVGAGLSSSAAYEMALLGAFEGVGGFEVEPMEAVLLAQRAEWDFAGVQCGVMDQAISRLGQEGHALLLDCRSLEYRQIPINVDAALVVCHTGVPRELVNSAYNERRRECEEAVEVIRRVEPGVRSLRDVTPGMWKRVEAALPEPQRRRARHVVTEDARVLTAADALRTGDLDRLAALFAASHRSLRDDYEVSSRELDTLVEIAHEVDARIAARLTGAGFGGCTVNLVPPDVVDAFERRVMEEYPKRTGRTPKVFRTRAANGASAERIG